ncbi:hypothetical protein BDV97DRAFT_350946 [Delphinella strobiligena]|nr:hypothetical protein BDV97DRAFT_350946 [Delphinella strobiligena]
MASINGSYSGTPPSHEHDGSPSGTTTPSGGGEISYVPTQNGRKRKADGTSSRGVANLTPEQLAKKRANDREAQRAIRERTKNTIENLERRIKELESQQPFQELQNVIRSRDAVQAENEELKRRMQSILALLQPLQPMGASVSQGLNDLAAATARQSPLPMAPPQAPMYHAPLQQQQAPPLSQQQHEASFGQHHLHPDLRINHAASTTPQRPLQQDMRRWSPSTPAQYPQQSQQQQQPQSAYSPDTRQEADRYGLHHLVESSNASLSESRRRELVPIPNQDFIYTRLPLNTEPTCTFDQLLSGFEAERRRAAQSGTPTATLVGPAYPSISSLLNPTRAQKSHPLSKVFTDIVTTFPSISDVPEQVAVLYIMFLIMRWHIAPTQENYERLPEWTRPVRSQLESAHPSWIDHLPWPMMRDRLVRATAQSPSAYPFESFFVPFTTTLSLNWPYESTQCLLPAAYHTKPSTASSGDGTVPDPSDASVTATAIENVVNGVDDGDEFMINPVFESHLRNLDNWSLGSPFRNAFPDLVEDVKIKDVRPPPSA